MNNNERYPSHSFELFIYVNHFYDYFSHLSEYELARQQQIEKNKAMLASLNISELTNTMTTPKR